MDIMRVDTKDGHHRFAMCTACYGYMGDLMHTSEGLRWLGPSRYNLAGLAHPLLNAACCLAGYMETSLSALPVTDTQHFLLVRVHTLHAATIMSLGCVKGRLRYRLYRSLDAGKGRGYHARVSYLPAAKSALSQRQVSILNLDQVSGAVPLHCCLARPLCFPWMQMMSQLSVSHSLHVLLPAFTAAFSCGNNLAWAYLWQYLTWHAVQVCYSQCELCHATGPGHQFAEPSALLQPSQQALTGPGVVTVEGHFQALMAVLMPCRSDRSAQVLPHEDELL